MASNTILEQLKEEANESKLVGLMKELVNATTPQTRQALFQKLDNLGKEPTASCKINRDIENFEFTEPKMGLDQWLCQLRKNYEEEPFQGMHWKVEQGVTYANIEENSFSRNAEVAVRKWRVELTDAKQKMTAEEAAKWRSEEMEEKEEMAIQKDVWKWNRVARTVRPRWEVLKRTTLGDTRSEDTALRYVRRPSKGEEGQVDWFKSIKELAKIGLKLGYTNEHYKATMDRWVSFFSPNLRTMTEPLEANRLARLLMKMTAPENEYDRLTHELYTLTRKAGTSLTVVLSQLNELATARAAEMGIANSVEEIARIMYQGMERFTAGKTKEEFLEAYEYNKREGRGQIPWERMMEKMIERERKYGMPTSDLRFSDSAAPGRSTSAFVMQNYNVNMKQITDPVTLYRPTSAYVDRREQYTEEGVDRQEDAIIGKFECEKGETKVIAKKGRAASSKGEESFQSIDTGEEEEDSEEEVPLRRSARKKKPVERLGVNTTVGTDKKKYPEKKEESKSKREKTPERKSRDSSYDSKLSSNRERQYNNERRNSRNFSSDRNSRNFSRDRNSRNFSRDRNGRNFSRDRNSRNFSRDRNGRNFSRDRNSRNFSRDRNSRNFSRDRNSGNFSGDRNSRNFSGDRSNRNDSRDRNNRREFRDRNRQDDRPSRRDQYNGQGRPQNRDRQRSTSTNYVRRDNSRQRSFDRFNRTPSRDRFRDRTDRSRQEPFRRFASSSRSNSRGRSNSAPYEWKPEHCDPGVNCAPGYSKDAAKTCSKCNIHTHREYECRRYKIWNKFKCRTCGIANHMENECKLGRNDRRQSRSPGNFRTQAPLNR